MKGTLKPVKIDLKGQGPTFKFTKVNTNMGLANEDLVTKEQVPRV